MQISGVPRRVIAFLGVEAFSAIGTWATIVAIWGYAAFEYGAHAEEVVLFGLAFAVPPIVLGPVTGLAIDRFGSKATLAIAKSLGVVGSLSLLLADSYLQFVALTVIHGVAGAFTVPALQSLPPRLVDDAVLARTNALVSLTDEIAIVVGPVVAGVSIAVFGFRGAFVVDALTYAAGLVALPLIRPRQVHSADGAAPPTTLRAALEGYRIVGRSPVLRRTVALMASVHLLYGAAFVIEPLYVRDVLERSPLVFASLQTVFGIFLVGAGFVVAALGERLASMRWVVAGVAASGGGMILYLATPFVVVAFVGVAIWGVVTAVISGPSRTVIQRHAPESAHGRVLATDFVTQSFGQLVGILVAGVLVGFSGVPAASIVLGAFVIVVAVVLGSGIDETGIDETGIDETGSDETERDEPAARSPEWSSVPT